MKITRAFVMVMCLLACSCTAAAANLVDAHWLAKNLESPEVLLLDASPRPLYAKGHIAGAVPVDAMALASFGVRDVPVALIDRMYQSLGIDASGRS